MLSLRVCLFGRFSVWLDGQALQNFEGMKAKELFAYLLLNRDRPLAREALAALLWGDSPSGQPRKYLRQRLWHLQTLLRQSVGAHTAPLLVLEADWVQLNTVPGLWLDVAAFEAAFARLRGISGPELNEQRVQLIEEALPLYRGHLLEGWYEDWCLRERERLQGVHIALLEKMAGYCESRGEYATGLIYAMRILSHDRAHERTHCRLMRLHNLAGDRTAALRQYQRCVAALADELGVGPDRRTQRLVEQIRSGQLDRPATGAPPAMPALDVRLMRQLLQRFQERSAALADLQHQVRQDISALEEAIGERPESDPPAPPGRRPDSRAAPPASAAS